MRTIVPQSEWAARKVRGPVQRNLPDQPYISSRKPRLLLDEDLGDRTASRIASDRRFKTFRLPRPGMDDDEVFALSRRLRALLVTGNSTDFWLKRRYPIEQTEGLLILGGNSDEERIRSFDHAVRKVWYILYGFRRDGTTKFLMVKAMPNGSIVPYGLGDDDQMVQLGA